MSDKNWKKKIRHSLKFVGRRANFIMTKLNISYTLKAKELRGKFILLEEASVTGTANIIMAAVLAKGKPEFTMQRVNLTF